ncbi:binding-protein-dependent transport systems inner membrane component [Paenibacillus vortex V453]|jgi:multiple sugar transport system permease protein|uniref:Binding-protein-dependent transport systems inner membrane component n=2 Tax=Paenibacillaceae TaxID=186822 RepID=A0A2R9SX16_9BACL|nr:MULTISPECIES: sugar ABC transporter permease [Paenibacillus]ANA81964.1 ABC transporter permease [Paenibacillus glucanolyticus]AVV59302.1 sugar ABC transporter permease [Paenibacillus glucanolyticus]EFU41856.1 binding-protein-dependent transport systems inner membrane component [Paenibacillus vortex V453]ETT43393.1 binding-protein-dependent transport systems inner membrane component [Paenibacillus sp. FSL R5-808]MPY16173.1 sugar ABC transporter permease [Paenibacillus glucanolyticus]
MNKKSLTPFFFVGPHLILFIVFILLPTIYGIYASFTQWNLINDPVWVGLANYKTILFNTESTFYSQFMNGLKNTLIFVVLSVPVLIIIPLMIAVSLEHKKVKMKNVIQSILYIPGLISISAAALIWSLIFNKQLGITNNIFGSETVWAANQPYAWLIIIVITIWGGVGGNMIIYRASISGVSKDLYESAEMDGAGPVRRFSSITLPSIRFPLIYTFVMTTAGAFNVFGQPLMMTDGGPRQSTTVLMMYIRQLAFGHGESIAGMASAMAVLLGLVILVISALQYYVMNRNAS